ncbi:MAG: thiol-activated cytolysin family protein [Cytophagales bacterium]|nr:thiol-activated cytolysin family protein [Cytophaga sp.]
MLLKRTISFIAGLTVISMMYCKKKHEDQPDYASGLNQFVRSAPIPVQALESDTALIGKSTTLQDGNYFCTEKKITFGYALSQQFLFHLNADIMYPGSLLDGNSIIDGSYLPIQTDRAPVTLSIHLDNINGSNTKTVDAPSALTIKEAIITFQSQGVNSPAPATMTFEYFDVSSSAGLLNAMGTTSALLKKVTNPAEGLETKLKESLEYGNPIRKNKFVFRYTQAYYSIDAAQPESPAAFFGTNLSAQKLGSAMNSYTAPVYVSRLTYGRVLYFCIESDHSFTDVSNAWKQSIAAVIGEGKGIIDPSFDLQDKVNQQALLKNSTIKAVVITGMAANGDAIVNSMDLPAASGLLKSGSNYDNHAPGLPISYVLRSLADNKIFPVVNSSEWIVRSCSNNNATVVINEFNYIAGDNTVVGTITVTLGYTDTGLTSQKITVWNNGDGSSLDLNAKSPIMVHYPMSYISIDPLRRNYAYLKIETSFYDKDTGDLDRNDDYGPATIYYNFNGNNTSLKANNSGGYTLQLVSTNDNYSERECCNKICIDKCRVDRSKGQNSSFSINFQIQ